MGCVDGTIERIRKWREICLERLIRSTFIVGYPGETDEDFEELLTFLKEAQLDRVGYFKYSTVDGAKENDLPDPIDENIKDIRLQPFMEVQSQISEQRLIDKIGIEHNIVIDSVNAEVAVGRTFGDAPEIDGVVYLNGVFDIQPSQRLWVEIIHTDEHDFWAVPVEEEKYEQALELGA